MTAGIGSLGTNGTSKSGSGLGSKAIAENFDKFLLLLTTQLKNQNPLEPLDTNQFTQQLVQFASVEQQMKSNQTLDALLNSTHASTVSTAAGFVGMQVTADGATSRLSGGKAEWRLNAPRHVAQAQITIKDAAGNVVASETKALNSGSQSYVWNGITSTGSPAPEGDYTITVVGRDAAGQGVNIKTEVSGRVDSVDMSGDEPVLLIGNIRVSLANVKTISRPSAAASMI